MSDEHKVQSKLPVLETDVYHATNQVISETTPNLTDLVDDNKQNRRIQKFGSNFEVPDDVNPLPLKTVGQQIILFNLCHKRQRPRSAHPGFRLLGSFPSVEGAADFCNQHYPTTDETVFAGNLHQLIPICAAATNQSDPVHTQTLVDRLIKLHTEDLELRGKDFDKNLEGQKTGGSGQSVDAKRRRYAKERKKSGRVKIVEEKFKENTKELRGVNNGITADKTLINQTCAVIVTLLDITPDALKGDAELQPLVAVLYVGSETDCKVYSKYTASKAYKDCAIDVVSLYQWCFPEHVDLDKIREEVYGNEKLNTIMDTRKKNNIKIKEYEEWYEKSKVDIKEGTVEIDPKGDLPRGENA
jgi:hypothetical protein